MITHSNYKLDVFQTTDTLYEAAAHFIVDRANKAIAERGRFVISLSGGQTPKKLYALLAKPHFSTKMPWKKTFVFWGDERCVPLDGERNNAHQAKKILLDKVDIPISNIHIIPVDLTPAEAAASYEKELNAFFEGEPLRFDLILLGLGENGHTASIFPGTKLVGDESIGIRDLYIEDEGITVGPSYADGFRVTMTAPLINEARNILFLVTGEGKTVVLNKVLNGPYLPDKYPAQLIKPVDGELIWFVDSKAGAEV